MSNIHISQSDQYDYANDPCYRNLSKRFFGDRIVKREIWNKLERKFRDIEWVKRQLIGLYGDYTEQIEQFNPELIDSWKDFMYNLLEFAVNQKYDFYKASTFIEIFVHLFQESINNRLSEETSFLKFKDIIVRHCLFRPPESISVFTLEELEQIIQFAQNSFYKYYSLYLFSFTPFVNFEIRTHLMFKSRFPVCDSLSDAVPIQRASIELLNEYLIDKETGLTPEQLQEIMQGDSIHRVPAKKRQEWLKLKEERERKEKIDKALQKELEKLQTEMDDKMKLQDEEFLQKVTDLKNPKKK